VNTGVVAWPDEDSAWATVRRMQLKLHRWASEDSAHRFGDLFNLVYDPAFLIHAWERVRSNDGARTAGIDGHTVAQIEARVGVDAFLSRVRDLLKSGEYRPSPVRRVKIPKGGGKLRSLGIPTLTDRVVQAACKAVLEPVFEADFLPCSYGFRPNRRAQDAIAEIHHFTSRPANYHYVLEADIAACFDEIDHVAVMDRVRRRIKDKRLCNLVKAFLKAEVLTDLGDQEESLTGTPQGGILTPQRNGQLRRWSPSVSVLAGCWSVLVVRSRMGMRCRMVIFSGPMRTSLTSSRRMCWRCSTAEVGAVARIWARKPSTSTASLR
jgi:RNA-directed DNA polymerase